jgi:hypothetical protein
LPTFQAHFSRPMDKADRALVRMYTANPVRFVRPSIPAVKPEKQAASCQAQACVVSDR